MGCAGVRIGEARGIVCGPKVRGCACCGMLAGYQCDYPVGAGRTCDAFLCEDHAIVQPARGGQLLLGFAAAEAVAGDAHYCPRHHRAAENLSTRGRPCADERIHRGR